MNSNTMSLLERLDRLRTKFENDVAAILRQAGQQEAAAATAIQRAVGGKQRVHWTQTPKGKRILAARAKAMHAKRRKEGSE